MLNGSGLMAVPLSVLRERGPVVAEIGTRVVIVVGVTVRSEATGVVLKSRTLSVATELKLVPTIVTTAPATAPGGVTNAMRGPSSFAI
jgi:hypothetical protein